jgi:amino acid adenylation domain-containing protein
LIPRTASRFTKLIASFSRLRVLSTKRLSGKAQRLPSTPFSGKERDGLPPALSFAQQRLWYLDQLEPTTDVYNVPSAFRSSGGALDLEVVKRCIDEIVRRHAALRTTFGMRGDSPVQVIAPSLEIEMPVVDLSDRSPSEREQELDGFLRKESQKPFNLARGPLLRSAVVRMDERDHVLFFVVHHTVFDGWSANVFQRELIALYEAFAAGTPSPLPDLPLQYADHAVWQREWLQGGELEKQLSYWKEQLGGELPVLELPADHPRPATQSFRGAREYLQIPKPLVEALTGLGRAQKATLFMVLVAAYDALLYRYTGQEDVCVGTPIASRTRKEVEGLIGLFANTLVLRTRLQGEPSFRGLMERVREVCLGAYAHQDIPFEVLVAELRLARDLSRTPLYQTMLAFTGVPVHEDLRMAGISLRAQRIDASVAQTDLVLWVSETRDGLSVACDYCADLFEKSTITRFLKSFEVLLAGIARNPDRSIAEIPLLTQAETRQLEAWNATGTDYPRDECVHQLFERQVEKTPDSRAVVHCEGMELTYRELNERANRLAHCLRRLSVGPDALVGIHVERSAEMLVGVLGILKAGGAYVPLDPDYPRERLAYMMQDAGMKVLVTEDKLKSELPESSAKVVCLDRDWEEISKQSGSNPNVVNKPGDLAYVTYTSGSTGKPKGVMVPHGAMVNFLLSMANEPGLSEDDVLLAVTTLSFDIHVLELYLPLIRGARVVVAGREVTGDGSRLLEALERSGATVMQATPGTWRILIAAGWQGSERLKVLCGGEALPRDLLRGLLERVGVVWNMYGPTETTVWSACHPLKDADAPILIGRPIANTTAYVLDRHMQVVPVGVPGELHIGGDGVTRGYWNRPELTAERFIPDPFAKDPGARLYRTGDVARYREDGSLEYLNRIDNQVKVRGFRIELGEIESVLAEFESVKQAVVVVKEVRPGDARLVAYVVPRAGEMPTPTDLRRHLRTRLPEYMVPQHFVDMDELPLTPAGKIDRKGLVTAFKLGGVAAAENVGPRTDTEKRIAAIWQEALGLEGVSVHDNFFEIGGHSLLAMQVISRIKSETGVQLNPRIILLNTLEQIAGQHFQESGKTAVANGQEKPQAGTAAGRLLRKLRSLIRVERRGSRR